MTAQGTQVPERYQPFPPFPGWCEDFDPGVVEQYAGALADARRAATPQALQDAVRVATRYAAVDTGAIEGLYRTTRGFTRTIAEQTAHWQEALAQHDPVVARSIQDALNAYDMVLDLTTGAKPVSQAWVRQLHEVICASQTTYRVETSVGPREQPMPKGRYKTLPNNPTNPETGRTFHYAPPDDTPAEMARLVGELGTTAFDHAHPVLQAAYAHYAFVRVHPFADGNGRVARALASVFLYRSPGVPLVVFADQRDRYLDALEDADSGRALPFVRFVADRTVEAVELVLLSLRTGSTPTTSRAVEQLRSALDDSSSSEPYQRELAAIRVRERVLEGVRGALERADLPDEVLIVESDGGQAMFPSPYSQVDRPRRFGLTTAREVRLANLDVDVWRAERPDHEPLLKVLGAGRESEALDLRTAEIVPALSTVAELKIDQWCDQQVAGLIGEAARSVAERAARTRADGPRGEPPGPGV